MSRSTEFIPTPPAWRHKGEVETHVPTMSAAEKRWRRHNRVSDTAPLTPEHRHTVEVHRMAVQSRPDVLDIPPGIYITDFERRVLGYVRTNGRLTVRRLHRMMDPFGLRHDEDIEEACSKLHARGYLKRNPGRGGPYTITERGQAMVS